jgi:uncharacterized RDD family membrane protein YckC
MQPRPDVTGRRLGAAVIDLVVLFVLFLVVGIALGEGEAEDGNASVTLEGAEALLFFALSIGYYALTEMAWGATVGKRLLGLVVVTEDGTRVGPGGALIRNVLRIVDGLPFLYLVGLVTMLVTERKQRIGDLAASTFVTAKSAEGQPIAGAPGGWGSPGGPPPGWGTPGQPGAGGPPGWGQPGQPGAGAPGWGPPAGTPGSGQPPSAPPPPPPA